MSLTNPNENLPPLFTASVSIHPGTLPSPEAVERYELVMSGAFDRILTMAEQEQQSKHELNMESLKQYTANNRSSWKFAHCGQFLAFFVIMVCFSLLGLAIGFNNVTMLGVLCGVGALAGLPALVRSFQKRNGGTSANIERQQNN